MEDDIKYIQNTVWSMYKVFSSNYNMAEYNNQALEICRKYKKNEITSWRHRRCWQISFCQNLIITWAPVINGMMEERKGNANLLSCNE